MVQRRTPAAAPRPGATPSQRRQLEAQRKRKEIIEGAHATGVGESPAFGRRRAGDDYLLSIPVSHMLQQDAARGCGKGRRGSGDEARLGWEAEEIGRTGQLHLWPKFEAL